MIRELKTTIDVVVPNQAILLIILLLGLASSYQSCCCFVRSQGRRPAENEQPHSSSRLPPPMEDSDAAPSGDPSALRQRVSRACANCRRRKTRCNGTQPCTRCMADNLTCTFDPAKYTSTTAYIRALERELQALQRSHQVALTMRNLGEPTQSRRPDAPRSLSDPHLLQHTPIKDEISTMVPMHDSYFPDTSEFGGLNFLARINKLCEQSDLGCLDAEHHTHDGEALASSLNISQPQLSLAVPWETCMMLPNENDVLRAAELVCTDICCVLKFLEPAQVQQMYQTTLKAVQEGDVSPHRKNVALIFALMALSAQFTATAPLTDPSTARDEVERGKRFFLATRTLLDASDNDDLTTLRTLLLLILYSQARSMLSSCYSYISMAAATAMRLGCFGHHQNHLHPQTPETDKIVQQASSIVAVLSITDVFVTCALGLPRAFRDLDSYLTRTGLDAVRGSIAGDVSTDACVRLAHILAAVVEDCHPAGKMLSHNDGFYTIAYEKVVAAEQRLDAWFAHLDSVIEPTNLEHDTEYLRAQLLLRLYYAHVQMVLYRPFLHHTLRSQPRDAHSSLRAYACGSACVKAAMQVVWIFKRMCDDNIFNPAHFWTPLIISQTAACLVLYVTSSKTTDSLADQMGAIADLKSRCRAYMHRNEALQRCLLFLEGYFPDSVLTDADASRHLRENFSGTVERFADAASRSANTPVHHFHHGHDDNTRLQGNGLHRSREFDQMDGMDFRGLDVFLSDSL